MDNKKKRRIITKKIRHNKPDATNVESKKAESAKMPHVTSESHDEHVNQDPRQDDTDGSE